MEQAAELSSLFGLLYADVSGVAAGRPVAELLDVISLRLSRCVQLFLELKAITIFTDVKKEIRNDKIYLSFCVFW